MTRALCLASLLILAATVPAAAAARLEVLPGQLSVKAGDRLRLTAVAWVGPEDAPVATLPPAVEWTCSAGQIDGQGLLLIPNNAPPKLVVYARVGSLEAKATLSVRSSDLVILPEQVRVLSGKALRFTVVDYSSGRANTPTTLFWSAEKGLVNAFGRYRAPDTPGADRIAVKVGDRIASAQILVVTSTGEVDPGAKPAPTPEPVHPVEESQPEGQEPAPVSTEPWRVRTWSSTRSGFSSATHKAVIEVYARRAAILKVFARKMGGAESIVSSRGVKPGETTTVSFTLSTTSTGARIVLYDEEGRVLASRSRGK